MKKKIFILVIVFVSLADISFAQMQTCYVAYSQKEKKIFIDVVPSNQIYQSKTDHLNGKVRETSNWFLGKSELTNNDFQEIKDDLDERLDAEAFVFSLVANIKVPRNYEFIISEKLLKYKAEILKAFAEKDKIGVKLNKTQGYSGETIAYSELTKAFGEQNVYPQVTVQTSDGTICRLDYIVFDKGKFICVEVKTGNAKCTPNQERAFPLICSNGFQIKSDTNSKKYENKSQQYTIGGKKRNSFINNAKVILFDDNGTLHDYCNCTR